MKYNQILKEMVEYREAPDTEYEVPIGRFEATEETEFSIGTSVRIHVDSFDDVVAGIEEQDRENVKQKLIAEEPALIFNEDGMTADVVFRDGAEIMNVPFDALIRADAPEAESEETNLNQSITFTDLF